MIQSYFLLSILSMSLIFPLTVCADSFPAKEIVEKMNNLINQETIYAESKMTITTSSKRKRTFVYDSISKNKNEKNRIQYKLPKRVKGQAILMLNHADDIWAYFPRTSRIRKLATHAKKQKMEGSDFTYEDMGSGDSFITDYESVLLGDEKKEGYDCYKLELIRKKDSDMGYSKLVMWVIKENFFPVVINYYHDDDSELLEKILIQSNIKKIDNIPTAMSMIMYNKRDNTNTTVEMIKIQYNIQLDDDLFSEKNLSREINQ